VTGSSAFGDMPVIGFLLHCLTACASHAGQVQLTSLYCICAKLLKWSLGEWRMKGRETCCVSRRAS